MIALASLIATIMLALSAFHVFWAFGGRVGLLAAVPSRNGTPLFRPGRTSTLLVASGLAVAGYLALAAADLAPWPFAPILVAIGCAMVAVLFAGRAIGEFHYVGFFKRVRTSAFAWWDTRVFSPLCVAISLGYFVLWYWRR